MKKIGKIMSLFTFVILLGGCLNLNFKTTINDDKSMILEIVYGINTGMLDQFGEEEPGHSECLEITEDGECLEYIDDVPIEKTCIEYDVDGTTCKRYNTDVCIEEDELGNCLEYGEEQIDDSNEMDMEENNISIDDLPKGLEENGFVVTEFNENNIKGVKITKKYNNIDDYSKELEKTVKLSDLFIEDNFDDSQLFTIKKGLVDSTYKANYIFDLTGKEEGEEEPVDYSQYASMFVMNYSVTLPNGNISNNATQELNDGKTLVWTLEYGKENIINYEFNFGSNTSSLIITIACIATILLVIIVFAIYKIRKNKKEKALLEIDKKAEEVIKNPTSDEKISDLEEIIIEDLSQKENKPSEKPEVIENAPVIEINLEPTNQNNTIETINIDQNNIKTLSENELVNDKKE